MFRFRREPSDGREEEHRCWWSSMIWLPGSVFAHESIGQGQPLADRMDIASFALQPSSPTSTRVPPLVGGCLPTRLAPLHLTRTRAKGGQNAPPGPQAKGHPLKGEPHINQIRASRSCKGAKTAWIGKLFANKPARVVAVALASKMARMASTAMPKLENYRAVAA